MMKPQQCPLTFVITGGQTGADQAGWRAAKAAGIGTGGAMPAEFMTEDGPRPEFESVYRARAIDSSDYSARTIHNVKDSDATLWFGPEDSPGGVCTLSACRLFRQPYLVLALDGKTVRPSEVVAWLKQNNVRVLNIAGNRESTTPGIGERVEAFLGRVFKVLGASAAEQG